MRILSLCIVSFVLAACSNKIQIPDIALKWDAGQKGAFVTHLVSATEVEIPKAQWDLERFGHACISSDDVSLVLAAIEKLCGELNGMCTYEQRKQIQDTISKISRAQYKITRR